MGTAKYVLRLLLLFIVGILLHEYYQLHVFNVLTIWMLSGFVYLVVKYKFPAFKKLNNILLFALIIFSGALNHNLHLSQSNQNHFTHHYLEGDELFAEVIDIQIGSGNFDKLILRVKRVQGYRSSVKTKGKILAYLEKSDLEINFGDQLVFKNKLQNIENSNNPGDFDQQVFYRHKGIEKLTFLKARDFQVVGTSEVYQYFWLNLREKFKQVLTDNLSTNSASLATALALGDKSTLEAETRNAFANAGAMHVLAVSGLHVGILLAILQWMFFQVSFLRKKNLYVLLAIVIIWCFALLTGGSPSVLRAALMFSLLSMGQLFGLKVFSFNGVFSTALLILLFNPMMVFDIGFQLSFLAILGIMLFYKPISNFITFRNKILNYFWEGTAIGIAAQIGTLPISLYYFNQFPNYFILTNIGLMILAGLALGGTLLLIAVSSVPFVVDFVSFVVDYIFIFTNAFVQFIADLPFSLSYGFVVHPLVVILAYLMIVLLWLGQQWYSKKLFLGAISGLFVLLIGIQYQRIVNMKVEELYVFNSYQKLIVWKLDGQIFCFYEPKKENNDFNNISFSVEAYKKKVGSQVRYISLEPIEANKSMQVFYDEKSIKLTKSSNGIEIKRQNDMVWFLPNKLTQRIIEKENLVVGKWTRNLSISNENHLNASKKAAKLI